VFYKNNNAGLVGNLILLHNRHLGSGSKWDTMAWLSGFVDSVYIILK